MPKEFNSRVSYKRRDLYPLLFRVFKQISLQKLPLAFSRIIVTLKTIRKRFKENIDSLETIEVESSTKAFQKNSSNLAYRNLVATKNEKSRASQTKWYRDCDLNEEEIDWKKTLQLTRRCTKNTKIIIFQFKFLQRRLPTNSFCIRLQLKIMIFAPFVRKKQTLCSTCSGNARPPLISGEPFFNGYNHAL